MKREVSTSVCTSATMKVRTGSVRRPARATILRTIAIVGVILLTALAALPAGAQSSGVSATVDRNQVTTDETVRLVISVDGSAGRPNQPVLPPLDGFRILGSSTGQQIRSVNGDTTVTLTFDYQLQPLHPGDLVIPGIAVTVGGQQVVTDPIVVTVTQGTGQPATPRGPAGGAGGSVWSGLHAQPVRS